MKLSVGVGVGVGVSVVTAGFLLASGLWQTAREKASISNFKLQCEKPYCQEEVPGCWLLVAGCWLQLTAGCGLCVWSVNPIPALSLLKGKETAGVSFAF